MRYHHSITESAELCGWSAAFAVMAISVVMVNTLTLNTFIKTKFLLTRKHVIIINITIAHLLFWSCRTVIRNVIPTKTVGIFLLPSSCHNRLHKNVDSYFQRRACC